MCRYSEHCYQWTRFNIQDKVFFISQLFSTAHFCNYRGWPILDYVAPATQWCLVELTWTCKCLLTLLFLLFSQEIPQQMNGSDCGMFTCKYADYITKDKSITFTQVTTISMRRIYLVNHHNSDPTAANMTTLFFLYTETHALLQEKDGLGDSET